MHKMNLNNFKEKIGVPKKGVENIKLGFVSRRSDFRISSKMKKIRKHPRIIEVIYNKLDFESYYLKLSK